MYVGILVLGVLGWALNAVCLRAEGRFLAWHRGAVGELER
jgi:ABC-type nitrate/sulfonate/bicarbonate transport system permease component